MRVYAFEKKYIFLFCYNTAGRQQIGIPTVKNRDLLRFWSKKQELSYSTITSLLLLCGVYVIICNLFEHEQNPLF